MINKESAKKAVHPLTSALMAASMAIGGPTLYQYLDGKFGVVIDKLDVAQDKSTENYVRIESIQKAMEKEHDSMEKEHESQKERIDRLYNWLGSVTKRLNEL